MNQEPFTAAIRQLVAQPTVCARLTAPSQEIGDLFGRILGAVFHTLGAAGVAPAGAPYGRYYDYGPETMDVEIGVPVAAIPPGLTAVAELPPGEVGAGLLPGVPAAVAIHVGRYQGLSAVYTGLERWMKANGHSPTGAPWEAYIDDPGDMKDMSNVRTEVVWPVG
ncbi:MAG TPA: GyrI-like domain-containing protein [Acidimicrobiia bacterium]|nr:GyrI-like domain-containing protein [Acidimicrobiia bacterium]